MRMRRGRPPACIGVTRLACGLLLCLPACGDDVQLGFEPLAALVPGRRVLLQLLGRVAPGPALLAQLARTLPRAVGRCPAGSWWLAAFRRDVEEMNRYIKRCT